jgi:hypothetical protein
MVPTVTDRNEGSVCSPVGVPELVWRQAQSAYFVVSHARHSAAGSALR